METRDLMYDFIKATYLSSTTTLIFYLMDSYNMTKKKYWFYLLIFITSFFGCLLIDKAYGYEIPHYEARLSSKEAENFFGKMEQHKIDAQRCEEEASKIIWYMPDTLDKEKAKYCLGTLLSSFSASTPRSKLLSMALTFLAAYGSAIIDQWQEMNAKIMEAKYHWEMVEWYETFLIKQGYREEMETGIF